MVMLVTVQVDRYFFPFALESRANGRVLIKKIELGLSEVKNHFINRTARDVELFQKW